jgi:hypothetical protein
MTKSPMYEAGKETATGKVVNAANLSDNEKRTIKIELLRRTYEFTKAEPNAWHYPARIVGKNGIKGATFYVEDVLHGGSKKVAPLLRELVKEGHLEDAPVYIGVDHTKIVAYRANLRNKDAIEQILK